jgi:hypothetical protein
MFWRCHAFGAACDLDGIAIQHADALQKLPKTQLKAVVEAPQDSRIAMIFLTRSLEVKYLFHRFLSDERLPGAILSETEPES